MLIKFFNIIKRFIISAVLIYSLDVLTSSLNISIPINVVTVGLVYIFEVPALICLMVFSLLF